jgi:hypothetical protein
VFPIQEVRFRNDSARVVLVAMCVAQHGQTVRPLTLTYARWVTFTMLLVQVTVHHRSLAWIVHTRKLTCSKPGCSGELQWDGHDVRVFRLSRTTAFTFEMLVEHLYSTLVHSIDFCSDECAQISSTPVHAFSRSVGYAFAAPLSSGHSDPQAVHTPTSRPILQDAIRAFQRRLVDYTSFSCETCGDIQEAPVLVGDGTSIAPPRELASDPHSRAFVGSEKKGSGHTQRVLIPDPSVRELIFRFCGRPVEKGGRMQAFTDAVRGSCLFGVNIE